MTPSGGRDIVPDWRAIELAEVGSTQADALDRAIAGERGPLWIRADVQTRGRGRSGRGWATPSGNFAATLLFAPRCAPASLPELSLVTGVAAVEAVLALAGPATSLAGKLRLKWPNDLLVGRAKRGGILVETTTLGQDLLAMIGIGINIRSAPPVPGREIAALADHMSRSPTPSEVLQALARSMQLTLSTWRAGEGFHSIRTRWLELAGPLGEPLTVNTGDGPVSGTFAGLDTDGALLLLGSEGQTRRFTFGDVTLGRS